MRKNPWCSIAPKPTGVRPHSLSPLSNCGSSNSYTRRRGPPYGIQSIYFRTGVKDVLARFGRLVLALARALRCGGTGAVAVSVWPGPLAGNARGVRLGDRAPRTHTAGGPLVPAVAGLSSDHAGRLAVSLGLSNLPRLGAQAGAGHAAEPPRGGNALCG